MERRPVDEFKSIRDNLFKVLAGRSSAERNGDDDDDSGYSPIDARAAKALFSAVFARAGKGKDEVVQIIAREIGMAVAAMLKEPLAQLAKNQRLQISFEFVPKDGVKAAGEAGAAAPPPAARQREAAARKPKRGAHRRKADVNR